MTRSLRLLLTISVAAVILAPTTGCHQKNTKEDVNRPAEFPQLASVRHVYVDQLGREEGSDLVREKIRILLIKSPRFKVVELRTQADAVLTGVAGVEKSFHSDRDGGYTHFAGNGVFRLVDVKSTETIWTYEYIRGRSRGSASSRVASLTVDQLHEDTKRADRDAATQGSPRRAQ